VLKLTCQLDSARPDVETLLKWSAAPDTVGNLARLSEKARAGVFELLENSTGLAGHLILGAIASGCGPDALPLGLVADVFGIFGEKEFGGRNFLELVSSFTTPPVVAVRYGASELGFVDPVSVLGAEGASVLSLGGRSWRVQTIDWTRRVVWVEPTADQGRSNWLGSSRSLSSRVSGAVKKSLLEGPTGCQLSKRASERIAALREQFDFLADDATTLSKRPDNSIVWWTFAGGGANATLAATLHDIGKQLTPRSDDWAIYLRPTDSIDLHHVRDALPATKLPASVKKPFAEQLKFSACLPEALLERTLAARLLDMPGAEVAVAQRLIHVSASPER